VLHAVKRMQKQRRSMRMHTTKILSSSASYVL